MVIFQLITLQQKLASRNRLRQAQALLKVAKSFKMKKKKFTKALGNNVVSDELLKAHFGLYEGYVKAYNSILEKLEEADMSEHGYSFGEFSELKRRLAVPYNGAVLHELYFEHLEGKKSDASKELEDLIEERWGSIEEYIQDIKSTALAAGNGWVVTVYDPLRKGLDNYLITEHHIGFPANCRALMVCDIWEHAFALDYKTDRESYVDKFLEELDFELVASRLSSIEGE